MIKIIFLMNPDFQSVKLFIYFLGTKQRKAFIKYELILFLGCWGEITNTISVMVKNTPQLCCNEC